MEIAAMENTATFQVYNASAGSGKTFSLVKEYLKIVLKSNDSNQFQYILAITFTNKAANEMKARIVKNLRQFADSTILSHPTDMFLKIAEEINLDPKIIHRRSISVLQQILTKYGSFSVSTIDSFTHKLIRNFAFDLGLPINFDVELKSKKLLDLAVDQLIAQIGKDEELTNFLIDYALQNIEENKSWDFTEVIRENAQVLLNESDRIHFKQTSHFDLEKFKTLNQKLFKRKKQLENEFKNLGEIGLQLMIENDVESHFSYSDLPNFFKKLINFGNNHNTVNFDGRLDKNMELEVLYSKSLSADKKAIIDDISEQLIENYNQSKFLFQKEYSNYVLSLLVSKNISAYAVLNHLNKELQKLKVDKNLLLSAEFNQLISDEIKDQPAPFIYEKLGTKFRHYFIDEMQDTSELQWQNLIPLIENALSQEDGSLMLVGDAKQSIYRWRGGKTEQFITLTSEEEVEGSNPFLISKSINFLETNYRSYKTVVNFNNDFFSHIAQYLVNINHQNLFLNTVKQEVKNDNDGGYIQVSFVEKEEEDEDNYQPYLRKIKSIIDELDLDFNKNDVCILVRKNKQGIAVANYLISEGIQVVSSESLLLSNSEKVDFIINLMTYIDQPLNQQAQFKIASFLYNHLEISGAFHDFVNPLINQNINGFFKSLSNITIDFNLSKFLQKSLYEATEYLIQVFRLAQSSDAYVQYFLDFLLDYQLKETNNLQGFLNEWELQKENLSIIAPENINAVRIMTVHKAKGLEFPIVIFPFDLEIRKELNGQTWIPSLPENEFDRLPTMKVNLTQQIKNIDTIGEQLYQERQEELALDNFNLLYVAFTRAIEQLYVISDAKKESKEVNYYSDLLKSFFENKTSKNDTNENVVYEIGTSKKVKIKIKDEVSQFDKEVKTIAQKQFIGSSISDKQVNIVTTSSKWWGTIAQEASIYGNKIHQLLAQVNTEDDVETVIKYARNSGFISTQEAKIFSDLLKKIVNHPNLNIYFQHNLSIFNEREILTDFGEIIIPDRIIVNSENHVTIIDYKTGREKVEHIDQINKYAFYIQQMGYVIISKLLVYINEAITIKEVD
ncbi:MAG: UvrD-helicase domain-containing protein [Flavobacteriaceae bacterium]|nr:UvrD-helicase domain-containing protein [Flavobacteriaceae bacterium]